MILNTETMCLSLGAIDKVRLRAQTHCTLTAARGMVRMYDVTGEPRYLSGARDIFNLYVFGGGMDAVVRHVEHLLDLGGDRTLALGGDLDGCDTLGGGITGVQDYPKLYAAIKARGYDAALLQDLFADNWLRVLSDK